MASLNKDNQKASEEDPLLIDNKSMLDNDSDVSFSGDEYSYASNGDSNSSNRATIIFKAIVFGIALLFILFHTHIFISNSNTDEYDATENDHDSSLLSFGATGPYKLVERQEGTDFFNYYDFYDGPDSLGSDGYNKYVSKEEAEKLGLVGVINDSDSGSDGNKTEEYVFMKSSPTEEGPRSSIRLEGKKRFDRGLFILDLRHMPNGPGVWPAFWLTDESDWPNNGEIDIVEGINNQSVAKTAMHTSGECDMFSFVPDYVKTGRWEVSTGIFDTYSGIPDYDTVKESDNCWEMAPHQWYNQGCVQVSNEEGTLGKPLNEKGGGIFALEWDPENRFIRSWAFTPHETVPKNILEAISTSGNEDEMDRIQPDTDLWGLPYAYFAIGEGTSCSADHFKGNRVVFDLAFCGTVAGNRFFKDCPLEADMFNVDDDSVASCNAYIKSDPDAMLEAYWKIKGLYIYDREMVNSDA